MNGKPKFRSVAIEMGNGVDLTETANDIEMAMNKLDEEGYEVSMLEALPHGFLVMGHTKSPGILSALLESLPPHGRSDRPTYESSHTEEFLNHVNGYIPIPSTTESEKKEVLTLLKEQAKAYIQPLELLKMSKDMESAANRHAKSHPNKDCPVPEFYLAISSMLKELGQSQVQ